MANLLDAQIQVDTSAAISKLDRLNLRLPEAKKALAAGVRKSLAPLKRTVIRNAQQVLGRNRHLASKSVNVKVWKSGMGGSVDILPVLSYPTIERANGSTYTPRIFRILWIEGGTRRVIGRNKRMHGATPPHRFFARSASQSAVAVNEVFKKEILSLIQQLSKQ